MYNIPQACSRYVSSPSKLDNILYSVEFKLVPQVCQKSIERVK